MLISLGQVLQDRLTGLREALEVLSVEKGHQQRLVSSMAKDLRETQEFIKVEESQRSGMCYFVH